MSVTFTPLSGLCQIVVLARDGNDRSGYRGHSENLTLLAMGKTGVALSYCPLPDLLSGAPDLLLDRRGPTSAHWDLPGSVAPTFPAVG